MTPFLFTAYIGPGAGFAFMSSFLILFATFALAFVVLLTWPVRWVVRSLRGRRSLARARARRVVVLGLDGQDPDLTRQFMKEGLLPNFERLARRGDFVNLETSLLAESPVAWSSFATGANPGKHRIYDFLVPNRKSHLPELSSAQVEPPRRNLKLGPYRIPLGKPVIHIGQKSKTFWRVLGEHGVFSTILRVPISFPPERFHGVLLSAMCAPDLKGSQGTYYYYSTDPADERKPMISGVLIRPERDDKGVVRSSIRGPENTLREDAREMRLPFEVRPPEKNDAGFDAELIVGKERRRLRRGEFTPWIRLEFRPGLGMKVRGICRFLLLETDPHFKLYMTPINIDPEKPALPISHPFTYAVYLAKTQGSYATLGVAEDTSALNENVIGEEAFLRQCWDIHHERERMFFDALEKTRRGAVVCVFDITDRLQHMFFRFMEKDHPALNGASPEFREKYADEIKRLYVEMDKLLGHTLDKLDDDTVLMVMSDHGFKPFRRGVNLNTWLHREGLLALKQGESADSGDMFRAVDWSKTKAYAVGFGGIYLNLAGREARGVVKPGGEAEAVKARIREGLAALIDPQNGERCVRRVYAANEAFTGPYVGEAPDLIAGFKPGYRVSWNSVTGGLSDETIEDNTRAWSGDHNFNPPDVPGMLFCNRPLASETAHIMDIGPTILDLFGVGIPGHCDGKSLMPAGASPRRKPEEPQATEKEERHVASNV